MQTTYTEQSYENSVIELFQNMGYTHVYGPDIENRDFYCPLYVDVLEDYIYRINPSVPNAAIQEALFKIKNFDNGELLQQNNIFMDYLQNGITVKYQENGEQRSTIVYLIDYSLCKEYQDPISHQHIPYTY